MLATDTQDLKARLEKLAFEKTIPFCYSCYRRAPTGRCERCGSDDLMRELPGHGVEWGLDWVVRSLIQDNLIPANTEEAFEESVSQCYPETMTVGWLQLDTVSILKEMDPGAWDLAESEWIDGELSDGNLITFDNGSSCYWSHQIEEFLDQVEADNSSEGD
jgi:hypothetical protein